MKLIKIFILLFKSLQEQEEKNVLFEPTKKGITVECYTFSSFSLFDPSLTGMQRNLKASRRIQNTSEYYVHVMQRTMYSTLYCMVRCEICDITCDSHTHNTHNTRYSILAEE